MNENSRIEDLRRRLSKDPASIAFAQLGEELRRAGRWQEAVDVCRAGLASYPGYVSARVTLGRALIELNQYESARRELDEALRASPENLAAIRALAAIHEREAVVANPASVDPIGREEPASSPGRARSAVRGHTPDPGEWRGPDPPGTTVGLDERDLRAVRTIAALQSWLDAIHVARASRSA
jgi:tetratricopeptide (TPR) repeat protein